MNKGLYIAYITGVGGSSVALYYIGDGKILGVDAGAMTYDGVYEMEGDGSFKAVVEYIIPEGNLLITGQSGLDAQRVTSRFILPAEFWIGADYSHRYTPRGCER